MFTLGWEGLARESECEQAKAGKTENETSGQSEGKAIRHKQGNLSHEGKQAKRICKGKRKFGALAWNRGSTGKLGKYCERLETNARARVAQARFRPVRYARAKRAFLC